jgi:hypothetical protein
MRRNGQAVLAVLFSLWALANATGCLQRPRPAAFGSADLPDPQSVYREVFDSGKQVRTLQGTAHVQIETEQQRASLDAVIVCGRAGRLRLEVLDWLNHVVFLALFDLEGFLTYSPAENRYLEGPDDASKIREVLGIPLQAQHLAALALGDPFFMPLRKPKVRVSVDKDENALLLDVESSGSGMRYLLWLDRERRPFRMFAIRAYSAGEAMGDLKVDYGRYRQIDAVSFPHRIRVESTVSKRFLQVDYQKIVLNESLEEDLFRFVPPAGATQNLE